MDKFSKGERPLGLVGLDIGGEYIDNPYRFDMRLTFSKGDSFSFCPPKIFKLLIVVKDVNSKLSIKIVSFTQKKFYRVTGPMACIRHMFITLIICSCDILYGRRVSSET